MYMRRQACCFAARIELLHALDSLVTALPAQDKEETEEVEVEEEGDDGTVRSRAIADERSCRGG